MHKYIQRQKEREKKIKNGATCRQLANLTEGDMKVYDSCDFFLA